MLNGQPPRTYSARTCIRPRATRSSAQRLGTLTRPMIFSRRCALAASSPPMRMATCCRRRSGWRLTPITSATRGTCRRIALGFMVCAWTPRRCGSSGPFIRNRRAQHGASLLHASSRGSRIARSARRWRASALRDDPSKPSAAKLSNAHARCSVRYGRQCLKGLRSGPEAARLGIMRRTKRRGRFRAAHFAHIAQHRRTPQFRATGRGHAALIGGGT